MKTSFRILLVALAILALPAAASAQTENRSVPKYEISFGPAVGMSGMGIMDKSAFRKGDPYFGKYFSAPKWVPSLGGHFGVYADFNFTDHLGLITGVEGAAYMTAFLGSDVLSSSSYPYDEAIVMNAPPRPFTKAGQDISTGRLETWVYCQLQNFVEEHLMVSVQIPVMFKYMTPIKPLSAHQYYLAAGAKFGIHCTPDIWFQSGSPGVYDAIVMQYYGHSVANWPKPEKEYGKYGIDKGNVDAEDWSYSFMHNEETCPVDVLLSLDTGFRWRLTEKIGLYTGLYCDFGLIRPIKYDPAIAQKLVEFDPSCVHNSGNSGYGAYAEWKGATHSSLATAAAPDYHYYNADESYTSPVGLSGNGVRYYEYTDKPYVKFLNNMQAGIKVRLAFALEKPEKKVRPPKEPKQPKPKPEKVPPKIQKTMMELSDALFAFDKFDLNEDARRMLDEVTEWLKDNPELNVEIGGHTDSRGSDAYNQKLSENRAKAVYDYFVSHGVSASRLSYKGYGESRPIATNETDEGRQRNRRVELQIQE